MTICLRQRLEKLRHVENMHSGILHLQGFERSDDRIVHKPRESRPSSIPSIHICIGALIPLFATHFKREGGEERRDKVAAAAMLLPCSTVPKWSQARRFTNRIFSMCLNFTKPYLRNMIINLYVLYL